MAQNIDLRHIGVFAQEPHVSNPIAVSSWSLHRTLGVHHANGPGTTEPFTRTNEWGPGEIALAKLPEALASRGLMRCELCHFHLASFDKPYLNGVGSAFLAAGITVQTLLIDDGDITNPATRDRDMQWISRMIEVASHLGAENARVIAGKQKPSPETLALSIAGLKEFAKQGRERGVRVVTENWFDLLAKPAEVHHVLDAVGPDLGFLADTGNMTGPGKYENLRSIFARAELCHAKTDFAAGLAIDAEDFSKCIKAAQQANYQGPYTLVFESEGEEWEGLAAEKAFIAALCVE